MSKVTIITHLCVLRLTPPYTHHLDSDNYLLAVQSSALLECWPGFVVVVKPLVQNGRILSVSLASFRGRVRGRVMWGKFTDRGGGNVSIGAD